MSKIECSVITYIGMVRGNNEDNYYVNGKCKTDSNVATEGYIDKIQRDSYIYAVCDGMGGGTSGEIASMIAVETLKKYQSTDIRRTITDYVQTANKLVCDRVIRNGGVRSGTTLALLFIRGNKAVSFNIGDSRVYLYRKGDLFLMSEDHTEAQRLANAGELTQEEADVHKTRNILTQYLGIFPDEMIVEPYVSEEVKLKKNDMLLLCSDGLTDMVSDDDIAETLGLKGRSTTEIAKVLASRTQSNGGKDNVTAIVVRVT